MAEQTPVHRWVAVDAASRLVDDPLVFEIGGQGVVICGKSARAADDRQSQHVGIVGRAYCFGAETLLLAPQLIGVGGYQASRSIKLHQLPFHILVLRKFFPQLAGGDEAGRAAFAKKPVDDRAGLHEELGGDVCVNNEAHVRYQGGRVLL